MNDFLVWLSSNSAASMSIAIAIAAIVIVAIFLYVIAFFQGREISFWPPKIGQKTDNPSSDSLFIKLEDRSDIQVSFEKRLSNAKNVALTGSSLAGIINHYGDFIQKKAETGCKFRFLIVHPEFYRGLDSRDAKEKAEVLHSVKLLEKLSKNENIKFKVLTYHPPFSITMVDGNAPEGFIQIEMYPYHAIPSERPHFNLTPKTDSKWYSFFREQFEAAWQKAQEYHIEDKAS
jgi:hypothetical protein